MLLALVMVLSAFPISAFAAPASDIPDKMLDNPIVRALAYTGYNVQKQKDNGTIYQTGHYGGALKRNAPSILSDIHYSTSLTGKETVSDSSTVTGKAPNIARFEQYGLCCASFVTYYICNYLPNIEGVDTQFITDAINATGTNSQAVVTWQNALNKLASQGKVEKVGTSPSDVDYSKLTPGDIIIFGNSSSSHVHAAIFAGVYNGKHFIIHVGNERGPEINTTEGMAHSSNGDKASTPNIAVTAYGKQGIQDVEDRGFISYPSYRGFYFDHLTLRRSTVPKTKKAVSFVFKTIDTAVDLLFILFWLSLWHGACVSLPHSR